jgi:EF-P beta-lysylation protein EpmB
VPTQLKEIVAKLQFGSKSALFSLIRSAANRLRPRGMIDLQRIKSMKKSSNLASKASFATTSTEWRQVLLRNFTRWDRLADFLELSTEQRQQLLPHAHFPLKLPYRLAEKVVKGTVDDPILRQFLPVKEELHQTPGFTCDPVGDQPARKTHRLLHKYEGRALLVASGACAMHCRFCFRRNFDYGETPLNYEQELEQVRQDSSVTEMILSGGDPLSLSNAALERLFQQLDQIPHLHRVRFHTRFPIGVPERVDKEFLDILSKTRLQTWFVIHCNHARELDEEILSALKSIQKLGIPVLCQTVLLRGVNDQLETLKMLYETLIDQGILPYYLHQLDRVEGAAHFEVSIDRGRELVRQLSECLPGFGVPKYVQEIAGQPSKQLL